MAYYWYVLNGSISSDLNKKNANSNNVSLKPSGWQGPMSSGKTSTIIALAKTMYKQRYKSMTLEMNASDARGIDVPVQQFWWVSSFVRMMRHKKKNGKTMKNWCFQHVEHPEHLNNRSVGKRSGETVWEISRLTPIPCLRYLGPWPFFLGLKPPSGISCRWQVVREQIKTFVSVKQLFASVEGQPKLVNLGWVYMDLCKVIGCCYLATQNISINMTWWINPCIL